MEVRGSLNLSSGVYKNNPFSYTAASGTFELDFDRTTFYRVSLTGPTTFTFTGAEDGTKCTVQLKQFSAGAHSVTWPGTVRWPGGSAPPVTASGIDYFGFIYDDEDSKYDGFANARDLS